MSGYSDQVIGGTETVEQLWEGFIGCVAPELATDSTQYDQIRRVFYAGGFAVLAWSVLASSFHGPAGLSLAIMERMDELRAFLGATGALEIVIEEGETVQ